MVKHNDSGYFSSPGGQSKSVIVIGAGAIGLCSAFYLLKKNYSVTVIDKGDITDGCSFGNMGYMSPSHFTPLAGPGIIAEGLKYMFSSSSPFYIKPRLNADLFAWAWAFRKNCHSAIADQNAPHLGRLLRYSRKLIDDFKREMGDHFELEEKGCLMMCRSGKALEYEYKLASEALDFNLEVERLDKDAVQKLEPEVELDVAGAVLYKDDCHFHPGNFMQQLKKHLEQKGVRFHLQTVVTGFEKKSKEITAVITDKGKLDASAVVMAAGSWLPQLAKKLGIHLLLQAGKGYSTTYENVSPNIHYPAILVDGRCAITPWGNRLRIGGTMELSGINHRIMVKRMKGIYDSARLFYPGLRIDFPPIEKIWCGLRPVTPDGLPYIGTHSQFNNLLFAGGHAMLGLSACTGTGKIVSDLVDHHTTDIDVSAFDVGRFGKH